jgi:hypothetical protein
VIIGMVGCDLFGGNTTNTSTSQTTIQTTTATTATTTLEVTTTEELSELTIQLMYIYDLAVEAESFDGTYEEWLETVRGPEGLPGEAGKEATLQVSEGYIQWQYIGDTLWVNLVSLESLTGSDGVDGKEVTFQVSEGYIQWQYVGDTIWTNLIELATLVGPQGETGNGIASAVINETGELVITYTDSTVVNLGQLLKVYQVVFKDYNGYVLDAIHVLHGFGVTAPDNPSRIGYTFSEWDKDFSAVT